MPNASPSPIRLSDEQLDSIMRICQPLHPHDRAACLQIIAAKLRGIDVLGDGVVARTAREAAASFWRPMELDPNRRHGGKYR
jgi:hypothetical protein